ncbi:hypothetical protein BK769_32990 [Bacillus thuringiensis serovar kumamtoensis]|uniref:Toxin n=2 Tax=Bacillus thuringiensis TaxID=1428 RepID=A0A9X6PMT7_BACUK|nr:hypothetical protein BK769_32990 [Bacillus thuringiensis serovar kumamtoensis]
MRKKMNKKPMVALILATSIGIPCTFTPGSALAAENIQTSVNENVKVGITDVQSELNKIGDYYYSNNLANTTIKPPHHWDYTLKKNPDKVGTNLDFSITGTASKLNYDSVTPIYIGHNEFNNDSDQPQKFTTSKFTKAVTEGTTSTVTNGFRLGNPGLNLFTIPLILSDGMKINAEFNSSTSESQQKSETKTIEASPQNIEVPAHKKYKVDVVLEQTSYWADVTFTGEGINLNTTINATGIHTGHMGMQESRKFSWNKNTIELFNGLKQEQKNNIHGIKFSNGKMNANGTGKVEGIFGSNLVVKVNDVTDPLNPILVMTKSLK